MTIPLVRQALLDVTSLATGADYSGVAMVAPFAAQITSVQFVPNGTMSGPASVANARVFGLVNHGSGAGTGTTTVAQYSMVTTANGLTDNVPSSLTLTTTALLTVAAGDVLEWNTIHFAGGAGSTTGVPDPGGRVVVTFSRI